MLNYFSYQTAIYILFLINTCGLQDRIHAAQVSRFGNGTTSKDGPLLADTKVGKNHAQQIVRTERAGDLVQGVLRQAQLFGQQVQRLGA